MEQKLEYEHARMRKLLDELRTLRGLTFRSEEVPTLLAEYLRQVYQHFKSEKRALSAIIESEKDQAAYDAHYVAVLEEISEIQFDLISYQDMPVASVLPKMEAWIADHERLHSHLRLPIN